MTNPCSNDTLSEENQPGNETHELVYDVLPIFEKDASDTLMKKEKSLLNNCHLSQKWQSYKDNYSTRVFTPFQFPDVRDYHFYKYYNRLIPTQSTHHREEFRMKLRPGPGVDIRGQIPVPNELAMKTTTVKKLPEGALHPFLKKTPADDPIIRKQAK